MKKAWFVSMAVALSVGGAEVCGQGLAEPAGASGFQIEVGLSYRVLRGVSFSPQSFSRTYLRTAADPSAQAGNIPALVGQGAGPALRIYDDGTFDTRVRFLQAGVPTPPGRAIVFFPSDPPAFAGGTATYHARQSAITNTEPRIASDTEASRESLAGAAPTLKLSYTVPGGGRLKFGLSLGAMGQSIDTERTGSSLSAEEKSSFTELTLTDRYAFFQQLQSLRGNLFIVAATPDRAIDSRTTRRTIRSANRFAHSLEGHVYTLSLGPTLHYEMGRLKASLSTGWAANIVNWRHEYHEDFSGSLGSPAAHWKRHDCGTKLLSGLYIEGSLTCALTSRWGVEVFGRYDWSQTIDRRPRSASVRVDAGDAPSELPGGPGSFHLDPGGFTVGSALVFQF